MYSFFDAFITIWLADVLTYFVSQGVMQPFDCLLWLADIHYYVIHTTWPYLSYLLQVACFNPYFV